MVRLQWTVRAKGEDDQFVRRNLMKTFRSVLSTIPPQAPVRSVTQSVCIIVLCGRVYASSSSILAIGSRCRLLTPTITFVKVKMYLVCAPQHREVRLSRNGVVHEWGLLHPARDFQQQQQPCLARRKLSLLYLLTATNNGLRSTLGRALCMTFWLGLTCYPEPQYTDLRDVSGRKAIRNDRGNPIGIQGESYGSSTMGLPLTLHVRSENISLLLTTIAGLDRAGLWLGLPGLRTSHQWSSYYEATLNPWFARRQLILKRLLLPVSVRQQQSSRSNLVFLSANVKFCCVVVGRVSKSVAARLNICSKLVLNIFLQTTSVALLDFKL